MTVEACIDCAGLTFTVDACRCTQGGDRFLVDEQRQRSGEPYRDCLLCRGDGMVAHPCRRCDQRGELRAQVVLTVVNADTGAAASLVATQPGGKPVVQLPDRFRLARLARRLDRAPYDPVAALGLPLPEQPR